jgi:hypothetical protein
MFPLCPNQFLVSPLCPFCVGPGALFSRFFSILKNFVKFNLKLPVVSPPGDSPRLPVSSGRQLAACDSPQLSVIFEMALAGRIALVTGAASGLGKATAVRLAGAGARVVLLDLASAKASLQALQGTLPASIFHAADVTSEADVRLCCVCVILSWQWWAAALCSGGHLTPMSAC